MQTTRDPRAVEFRLVHWKLGKTTVNNFRHGRIRLTREFYIVMPVSSVVGGRSLRHQRLAHCDEYKTGRRDVHRSKCLHFALSDRRASILELRRDRMGHKTEIIKPPRSHQCDARGALRSHSQFTLPKLHLNVCSLN